MKKNASAPDSDGAIVDALDQIREELRSLRDVLDEIRSEFEWANRNRSDSLVEMACRITSMSLDAAASDWAQRLNRFSADSLCTEDHQQPTGEQAQLF